MCGCASGPGVCLVIVHFTPSTSTCGWLCTYAAVPPSAPNIAAPTAASFHPSATGLASAVAF